MPLKKNAVLRIQDSMENRDLGIPNLAGIFEVFCLRMTYTTAKAEPPALVSSSTISFKPRRKFFEFKNSFMSKGKFFTHDFEK